MKKLFLLLMLIATPVYALETCSDANNCIDYPDDAVQYIETTATPGYGINIKLKNGHVQYMEAPTRSTAVLMLEECYRGLQDYYHWTDDYFYQVLEKQDKAQLRIK